MQHNAVGCKGKGPRGELIQRKDLSLLFLIHPCNRADLLGGIFVVANVAVELGGR